MKHPSVCDIVRTKQIDIAEHEILLSFHSDEDAVRFFYWWSDEGEQQFLDKLEDIEV